MNNPIMSISDRASILERDHSKNELVALARAKGWKGDPERAYTDKLTGAPIHQSSASKIEELREQDRLATGKTALAYYIAGFSAVTQATEPTADPDPMTAEQSTVIQRLTDEYVTLGGSVYELVLTGNYENDHATLNLAIQNLKKMSNSAFTNNLVNAIRQQPIPQPAPVQNNAPQNDKMAQLMALIQEVTQPQTQAVDRAQVQKIVVETVKPIIEGASEAMQQSLLDIGANNFHAMLNAINDTKSELLAVAQGNAQPKEIIITTPTGAQTLGGTLHPKFEKILRLVNAGINVLLVGGAGSGKTHLAEQIAKALKLKYGCIHGSSGASESQLAGWLLPTGTGGQFEYRPAPFVELYEQGNSLFCLDELDAFDPNMLLIANSALSNDYISIPQRLQGNRVDRGENAHIIATANTYGTGADMIYSGRNQLDGATLDRFYMVHIDYMTSLEAQVLGQPAKTQKAWTPAPADEESVKADLEALYKWLNDLREKVTASRLRRVISTRAYFKADKARRALVPVDEIKSDLLMGWTADELRKVGAL